MIACSLLLLGSLACLGAAQPIETGVDPQWMLLRERRAVGGAVMAGSFYSAPLRKQECENCNKLTEEQPEAPLLHGGAAQELPSDEAPALVDVTKYEVEPERKPKNSKVPKVNAGDNDDDSVPAPRKGGKPSGSVYKNFFPMNFGSRVVRDVEGEDVDADVQANAKAEPDDDEEEEDEDDDDFSSRSAGSVYKNFFPMTFGANSRYTREAEGVEGGRAGGVISIANSFSKGRGAVASSSATAYGSPSNANQHRSAPPPAVEEQQN